MRLRAAMWDICKQRTCGKQTSAFTQGNRKSCALVIALLLKWSFERQLSDYNVFCGWETGLGCMDHLWPIWTKNSIRTEPRCFPNKDTTGHIIVSVWLPYRLNGNNYHLLCRVIKMHKLLLPTWTLGVGLTTTNNHLAYLSPTLRLQSLAWSEDT